MTNEEKARKIATINHYEYVDKKDTLHSLAICEKSALEMAEWKDQQFKEYLEKKKLELKFKVVYGSGGYYTIQISTIDKIINEFFGGE